MKTARWDALVNPAGGFRYHLRAARYADTLWQPLRESLAAWLSSWQPPESHLLLIGPSAGYTLPLTWLANFDHLTVLEPDPFASWLLRRRLTRIEGSPRLTLLADDHLIADPERLVRLTREHPEAAILFSNVLGQLRHLLETDEEEQRLQSVKRAVSSVLPGRSWASYHDRVSGTARPDMPAAGLHTGQRLTDAGISALYARTQRQVTLFDHASDGIFSSDLPHAYFSWELTPGYVHLLEGVCQSR